MKYLFSIYFIATITLYVKGIYSVQWSNGIPVAEETDCAPKCIKGGTCAFDTKDKRFYCSCPENQYYHETLGCQKTVSSSNSCVKIRSSGEVIKSGPLKTRVICICNPGYSKGYDNFECVKNYGCDDVKCAPFVKCGIVNGHPKCLPESGYTGIYSNKVALREDICNTTESGSCLHPAVCSNALNKNGPRTTACSCPEGLYLTRDMRQCAKLETFPPNHVYTIRLAEESRSFPKKFDIYFEGCFNVSIDKDRNRLIYQTRDLVNDLDVNVEIPTGIKSIHFKTTNTTLNIFANDNNQMHPLFSTYFSNMNCRFLANAHLPEGDNKRLMQTIMKMDALNH